MKKSDSQQRVKAQPELDTLFALEPLVPVLARANQISLQAAEDVSRAEHSVVGMQVRQLIDLASAHVSIADGHFALDPDPLRKALIAESDIALLEKLAAMSNHHIDAGSIAIAADGAIIAMAPGFFSGLTYDTEKWRATIETNWWGVKVCFNHEMTEDIIAQLTVGVGAAALLALLEAAGIITAPKAVLTCIVGLLLVVTEVRLLIASQGNGVCIYLPWAPPGVSWISPR